MNLKQEYAAQTASQNLSDFEVEIGTDGLDAAQIVAQVKTEVERKTEKGVYRDLRIAQAERHNLQNLQDDEKFLQFYLQCLREAACVDINDFEIYEKRRFGAGFFTAFKRILWKLLKFYTYRLWSQQNQVNGLLVTALEGLDEKYRSRIAKLEQKVETLQKQQEKETPCQPPGA